MVRPRKCRQVGVDPASRYYKPDGVPVRQLKASLLLDEELEALRLADALGLEQEMASQQMNVSRSTFSRILSRARHVVADALVSGKALKIDKGGDCERVSDFPEADISHKPCHGNSRGRRCRNGMGKKYKQINDQ